MYYFITELQTMADTNHTCFNYNNINNKEYEQVKTNYDLNICRV